MPSRGTQLNQAGFLCYWNATGPLSLNIVMDSQMLQSTVHTVSDNL